MAGHNPFAADNPLPAGRRDSERPGLNRIKGTRVMNMRLGYFFPEFPSQTHVFFWREIRVPPTYSRLLKKSVVFGPWA